MRKAAHAAIAALGLAFAASAAAQDDVEVAATKTFTDPAGRFTVQVPEKWPVDVRPANGFSFVVAGDEFAQCQFVATPRPSTADSRADVMKESTTEPITPEAWKSVLDAMDGLFEDQGVVVSNTVDTTRFWPVQRAQLMAPFGPLEGAITFRPGLEIWTFCTTPGNIPAGGRFEPVFASLATPADAQLEADAIRLKAEADAEYARIQAAHEAALAEIHRQQAEAEARQNRRSRRRSNE